VAHIEINIRGGGLKNIHSKIPISYTIKINAHIPTIHLRGAKPPYIYDTAATLYIQSDPTSLL